MCNVEGRGLPTAASRTHGIELFLPAAPGNKTPLPRVRQRRADDPQHSRLDYSNDGHAQ